MSERTLSTLPTSMTDLKQRTRSGLVLRRVSGTEQQKGWRKLRGFWGAKSCSLSCKSKGG